MFKQEWQTSVYKQLLQTWQKNKLVHAYLFHGQKGTGKKETALWLAQTIFCQTPVQTGACLRCSHCLRIIEGEFPSVEIVEPDGASLKVDQIRQLKSDAAYSSLDQDKKIYIVDQVETMSVSAANSLLKFLEEPQDNVYFILLTSDKDKILPTILSRCQSVYFQPIVKQHRIEQLMGADLSETMAFLLATITQDTEQAMALSQDEEFQEFRQAIWQWVQLILRHDATAFVFVQTKLMQWLSQKDKALLGLDLLTIYIRDVYFIQCQQQDRVYFKQHQHIYEQAKIDAQDFLTCIVREKERLSKHVSAQVCYERVCLAIVG